MNKIILLLRKFLIPLELLRNIWRRKIICKIPEYKEMMIRKNTSDESVFWQVFVKKEYDFPISIEPKLIIDGGANIGCAALWFAKKFPKAKIIAIEPEESNFKILEKNTSHLPNVKIIRAGIWNENTNLKIKDVGLGKWSFETERAGGDEAGGLPAMTIDKILEDSGFPEIDILKLDIEGSEKEVFEKGFEKWLGKTKILIIELHEYLKSGVNKIFYSAISGYGFKKSKAGEKIVLIK